MSWIGIAVGLSCESKDSTQIRFLDQNATLPISPGGCMGDANEYRKKTNWISMPPMRQVFLRCPRLLIMMKTQT